MLVAPGGVSYPLQTRPHCILGVIFSVVEIYHEAGEQQKNWNKHGGEFHLSEKTHCLLGASLAKKTEVPNR